jgi:hypothetical protein
MSDVRLGSRGDSYYEYLLKQYLQTGRSEPRYRAMYDEALSGIREFLVKRSPRRGLLHTRELQVRRDNEGRVSVLAFCCSFNSEDVLTVRSTTVGISLSTNRTIWPASSVVLSC